MHDSCENLIMIIDISCKVETHVAVISIIIKQEHKCLEMNEPVTHDPLSGSSFQEGSLQKDSNSCLLQNVWTTLLTDPERHMFKVRQIF